MVFDISQLTSTIREASLTFELQHAGTPAKLSLFAVSQDDAPYNLHFGAVAIVTARNKTLLNTLPPSPPGRHADKNIFRLKRLLVNSRNFTFVIF
jgi:hypothetical protein